MNPQAVADNSSFMMMLAIGTNSALFALNLYFTSNWHRRSQKTTDTVGTHGIRLEMLENERSDIRTMKAEMVAMGKSVSVMEYAITNYLKKINQE